MEVGLGHDLMWYELSKVAVNKIIDGHNPDIWLSYPEFCMCEK